jgi:hypothetical protein
MFAVYFDPMQLYHHMLQALTLPPAANLKFHVQITPGFMTALRESASYGVLYYGALQF